MFRELVLFAAVVVSAAESPSMASPSFHVVVNRSNPVHSIRREELSAIFMKRMRAWPGGVEIVPVEPRSRVREEFCREIHGKSLAYVTRYWHRVIFSGRGSPPRQAKSADEIIEIVAGEAGAVGYIDRPPRVDEAVKRIEVVP